MGLYKRSASDAGPVLVPKNIEKVAPVAVEKELVINIEALPPALKPVLVREMAEEVRHVPKLVLM